MGSINDNGSGGHTAYRVSKAGVNMLTKGMSCDLKDQGISVMSMNPGFVETQFGPGMETLKKMGGKPVDKTCECMIKQIDKLTIEDTGKVRMDEERRMGGAKRQQSNIPHIRKTNHLLFVASLLVAVLDRQQGDVRA